MADLKKIQSEQERAVVRAFRKSVQSIRDQVTIQEIVNLLNVGNVSGVIDLLQLDASEFQGVTEAIRQAYITGGLTGAAQVGAVPVITGTLVVRFNIRLPRAERWLADMSSRMVVEVFDEQRAMVRSVLTDALAKGTNPRTSALDLVGRVNRQTRKRTGGFIGMTEQQARWSVNARQELQELNPNYLTRELRDRRFDAAFNRALSNGTQVPSAQIDAAITQMQNNTLRYRGEVISRTESINALRAGQVESIEQAIELGEVEQGDTTKKWDASGDARTRPTHAAADGQERAFDQPFEVGKSELMYPGDPGGPASETIQCRCTQVVSIDFGARVARVEGFG
jgi:uncharacterized protein with gpF-like domain